jgi:hypothetical protein
MKDLYSKEDAFVHVIFLLVYIEWRKTKKKVFRRTTKPEENDCIFVEVR